MGYDDFNKWIDENCPDGTDRESFIEYLAMVAAVMLQSTMDNTGKSIDDLIDFSFGQSASLYDA